MDGMSQFKTLLKKKKMIETKLEKAILAVLELKLELTKTDVEIDAIKT